MSLSELFRKFIDDLINAGFLVIMVPISVVLNEHKVVLHTVLIYIVGIFYLFITVLFWFCLTLFVYLFFVLGFKSPSLKSWAP